MGTRRAIVLLCLVGCNKGDSAAREQAEIPCQVARAEESAEAIAWLARDDTMGFEVDKATMRDIAREFYDAGATEVEVVYSTLDEDEGGVEIGGYLVVTLPRSKDVRSQLIAVQGRLAAEYELDPVRDLGQTCLIIALD